MRLRTYIETTSTVSNAIGAGAIIIMMLLTCTDVVLRFFRHPIPGTYEIVGLMGIIAVSLALGATTIQQSHIAVEFLTQRFSHKIRSLITVINDSAALFFFSLLSRACIAYGNDLKLSGEVSLTVQIPLYPFVYGIAAGCVILCLVLASDILQRIRRSFAR